MNAPSDQELPPAAAARVAPRTTMAAASTQSRAMVLPARVARAIRAAHANAELTIGWFQIGIVVFFALFYLLSPRPADAVLDPMLAVMLPPALAGALSVVLSHPVPWVLSLYFVATIIRLVWCRRGDLPGWALIGSIVIDMSLLLALIWSFHIQYQQPPAFYLKAPTLLYVFIFIALRALRFEERYVLIAGVVAAIGWLALVAYAALMDPRDTIVTHNYVEYMSNPLILWGAEIDKMVAILMVSFLLFLSIRKGRQLLVSALAEGEAAHDLKRFFGDDVVAEITGADERIQPGQGRLCEASVLFLDLRGFTSMSRMLTPNQTVAVLGDYQARMVPIIRRNGGSVDKFLGDGILASFGATHVSGSHAADALRTVDAVMDEAERWSVLRQAQGLPPARVGAAVATGTVLFGAVGDATRLEYTVIGDAVNLAAKLEKQTKIEQVRALTDAATLRLAQAQGYAIDKPLRTARVVGGVDQPLDLAILA